MNFLAHQYLSFNTDTVMVGNFIADTIKGVISDAYLPGVILGVNIHRSIDSYTDSHPIVLETRKLLYPYFGKYAAVVQDVYYDHFLAINWSMFSKVTLSDFVFHVYLVLNQHKDQMNAKALRILHFMESQDWLQNYQTIDGIDRALKGLSRRATFQSNMEVGIPALKANYNALNAHFTEFFPLLEKEMQRLYGADVRLVRG